MNTEFEILIDKMYSPLFNIDNLYDDILKIINKKIPSETSTLFIFNKLTNLLEAKKTFKNNLNIEDKRKLKLGEGMVGCVAQNKEPVISPNPNEKNLVIENTNSFLCIPIIKNDELLAVIELTNKIAEKYSINDFEKIKNFGMDAAKILAMSLKVKEKDEKIEQLSTLIKVSNIINSTLDLKNLLNIIMTVAKEVVQAEASSLMILNEETNELEFEIATGEKGEAVKKIHLKLGEGIGGWVALHGESVFVPDTHKDPRWYKKADEKTDFITRSMICIPLKVKNKIIGAAQVLNKINDHFTEDDLRLFESLGQMAAIAIDNAKQYKEKEEMFLGFVKSLAAAIDAKDPYTRGHSDRVTSFSLAIAAEISDLSSEFIEILRLSAILHDIGKIGLDDSILRKPDKLTDNEFLQVKKHPEKGADIMSPIKQMKNIIPGMNHHHERYDGRGYPHKLKGNEINLTARIISIADTFDAMTSDRPYRKGLDVTIAIEEIKKCSGTQFDPEYVKAFIKASEKGTIQEIVYSGRS